MTTTDPNPTQPLQGQLFAISAPSGAGKSSLVRSLLATDPSLKLSISHTTRAPRGQEKNGKEYWFISQDEFKLMIAQGDFFEWAQVHENYYGTSRQSIQSSLQNGQNVILEIDWQGALQIKSLFKDAVLIFISPPSFDTLKSRLIQRGEDSPQVIEKRLINAQIELGKAKEFDFVIINDNFESALADLRAIVQVQCLRYNKQKQRNAEIFTKLGI